MSCWIGKARLGPDRSAHLSLASCAPVCVSVASLHAILQWIERYIRVRPIRAILDWSAALARKLAGSPPIADGDALEAFIASQASYVAQSALYGYLKARMGTQFRRYFENDAFAATIRAARTEIVIACAADLTVHAVAMTGQSCAAYCQERLGGALRRILHDAPGEFDPTPHLVRFASRVEATDWVHEAVNPAPFARAADSLIANAPVVEEFKDLDREIARNSVIFRMAQVQDQLRRRLDRMAIADEIRAGL